MSSDCKANLETEIETKTETGAGTEPAVINSWEQLNCSKSLLRGIFSYGFEQPSPIQKRACAPMIAGHDIIAQAQSGTGKTGSFTIGALAQVDTNKDFTQAIIISPTRELSMQTYQVISSIGSFINNLTIQLLIGGTSMDADCHKLQSTPPHVVIGCPGRIHSMLRRRKLSTSKLKLIVLDEADEMLSGGFKEQIYNIFQFLPSDVQVALFSATLPSEITTLTDKFRRNPIRILVKSEQLTLEGIKQFYIALENDYDKYDTLKDIYSSLNVSQCIIYCNSVRRVQDLCEAMNKDGFPVCQIHSNMERDERTQNYQDFRDGRQRILISSDVTARGIDIQQVSIVINFDIPRNVHTYLHRIGRSGRWGRKGLAVNFVTRSELRRIRDVEKHYSTQIEEFPENWTSFVL